MDKNSFTFKAYRERSSVYYGKCTSICGEIVVLATEGGICGLHFLDKPLVHYLHLTEKKFNVLPVHAPSYTQDWWQYACQAAATPSLVIQGTAFQRRVWQALCAIPVGTISSYQALAAQLGVPKAARAVASAIAQNFIAWLIPCHRVVRKNGQISGYRWGIQNKITLLKQEKNTIMLEGGDLFQYNGGFFV